MFLYGKNKKGDSIDIYSVDGDIARLEKFKKEILSKCKIDDLFYRIRTNFDYTVKEFSESSSIDISHLNYDDSTPLDIGTWSTIMKVANLSKVSQNKILDRYIAGEFSKVIPTIVNDGDRCGIYYFLMTEDVKVNDVLEIDNIINLPKDLYLLQLLENGDYSNLVNENISHQLDLFDINYVKSVRINDIKEMFDMGLVDGSFDSSINKSEIGSKILGQRKIKNRKTYK